MNLVRSAAVPLTLAVAGCAQVTPHTIANGPLTVGPAGVFLSIDPDRRYHHLCVNVDTARYVFRARSTGEIRPRRSSDAAYFFAAETDPDSTAALFTAVVSGRDGNQADLHVSYFDFGVHGIRVCLISTVELKGHAYDALWLRSTTPVVVDMVTWYTYR